MDLIEEALSGQAGIGPFVLVLVLVILFMFWKLK